MRRIFIIAVTLAFISLICVSGQTPNANTQRPQLSGKVERPKGKVLVNKLPSGSQGVSIKNGAVKLKPGYKFVKQENGTVSVARIKGGGAGVGGTWDCSCWSGTGGCEAYILADTISCLKSDCTGSCKLSIVIKGAKTGVIMY